MNSLGVLVLATLMVSAVNCQIASREIVDHEGWGHGIGGTILSKKDAATVEKVLETINSTIQQAYEGIDSRVLSQAMKTIIADVNELTAGQKVDAKAVNALILKLVEATDLDSAATPSDGPFWPQRKALSVTLTLLQELAKTAEELEESGESVVPALEAIGNTAETIRVIENESESLIEDAIKHGKDFIQRTQRRRRSFSRRAWSWGFGVRIGWLHASIGFRGGK